MFADVEFEAFGVLWNKLHRRPSIRNYRSYVRGKDYPSVEEVEQKWGSYMDALAKYEAACRAATATATAAEIPDYLLGALVARGKVATEKRGRSTYLRFTSLDREQIDMLCSMLDKTRVYLAKKNGPTWYLRSRDAGLISYWEQQRLNEDPVSAFRENVDFVRGYIDTHSHFRKTTRKGSQSATSDRLRLTITGPLVPKLHDYLCELGAKNTTVYKAGSSYRMNIHSNSLRKIRDTLYPSGCTCNTRVREQMYRA